MKSLFKSLFDLLFKLFAFGSVGINLFAIILGLGVGLFFGKSAGELGIVSWLPVAIIKGLASPLLFLAILNGLMNEQLSGKGVLRMLSICSINAVAAVVIAASLVNFFEPGFALKDLVQGVMSSQFEVQQTGSHNVVSNVVGKAVANTTVKATTVKTTTWADAMKGLIPESVVGPFYQNNIPAILVLAILFGLAVRKAGRVTVNKSGGSSGGAVNAAAAQEGTHWALWFLTFRSGMEHGLSIVSHMMGFILKVMPFAIFASVAKATGEHGLGVFKGLAWYVLICIGGMFIQIIVVYQSWILFRARRSLQEFWRYARLPVVYAFGVNSSLAALPTTLNALDQLKVSSGASRLGACVGTNFNNDGILLYEVAALLMLGQAAGFDWSIAHQIGLAGICVLATLGVSGFPEAGVIALSLVLASAGLPVELLPLLLPVDWLVARMRSATNVISDMTVSMSIDAKAS